MGSLPGVPGGQRFGFLGRERREKQVRIAGLPRQCLGFIQGEAQQMLGRLKSRAEFGQDGLLCPLDLGSELLVGRPADVREGSTLPGRYAG